MATVVLSFKRAVCTVVRGESEGGGYKLHTPITQCVKKSIVYVRPAITII